MQKLDIPFIENTIGYVFNNKDLIVQAFTHSSFTNENTDKPSYERLEFLGDAAIGYIMAHELYKRYSDIDEGKLSKSRAALVSWQTMSKLITDMNIIEFLQVGNGDIQQSVLENDYIKCDLFEAIAGAILVDSNFKISNCKNYVMKFFENGIADVGQNKIITDYKSYLLEECAKNNKKAQFVCQKDQNDNMFNVTLNIDGQQKAQAKAGTKKEAEKKAAETYINSK